jgi:hypothetical protein
MENTNSKKTRAHKWLVGVSAAEKETSPHLFMVICKKRTLLTSLFGCSFWIVEVKKTS